MRTLSYSSFCTANRNLIRAAAIIVPLTPNHILDYAVCFQSTHAVYFSSRWTRLFIICPFNQNLDTAARLFVHPITVSNTVAALFILPIIEPRIKNEVLLNLYGYDDRSI